MFPVEHFFFPAIVLLGIFLVVLSAKLVFRLMLVFVAILVIWFGLFLLGLAPSPINYFKNNAPKEIVEKTHHHVSLDDALQLKHELFE